MSPPIPIAGAPGSDTTVPQGGHSARRGADAHSEKPLEASADPALFVAARWADSDGGRLPGEESGITLFEILFQDGCRHFAFTGTSVFERLVKLSSGSADVRSNPFLSAHCRQMSYVVRCVASNLDQGAGRELRDLLVAGAPSGVSRIDGTTAMSPDCWLKEGEDVEVMTFAEWAKTTGGGPKNRNPE